MKCLKNLFKVKEKIKDDDTEIEEAAKELKNALSKIGILTNNNLFNDKIFKNSKEENCEDENSSTEDVVEMNLD